jgi:uncharacterized membrane protein YphA (DoxX/SURF4 family)
VPARRGIQLQYWFSAFPSGLAGVGLIFLRIAVALAAFMFSYSAISAAGGVSLIGWVAGSVAIVVGLALLIGFLTPVAAAIATMGFLIMSVSRLRSTDVLMQDSAITWLCLAVMSIALVLIGPGALSLDARIFGRREIIIPEGRRPPR